MADEDQRAARKADVAGGDRREAERSEGSNDSWHEQMDSRICSKGIRFLRSGFRTPSRPAAGTQSPPGASCVGAALARAAASLRPSMGPWGVVCARDARLLLAHCDS